MWVKKGNNSLFYTLFKVTFQLPRAIIRFGDFLYTQRDGTAFPLCEVNRKRREEQMNNKKLRRMILIAILGSIATVLMQFNFPLPALPGFLKIDFGEIPAVLAVMTMGPVAGIACRID